MREKGKITKALKDLDKTERDGLIELMSHKQQYGIATEEPPEAIYTIENHQVADYLLANGVIVPPCKVGDNVYVITPKRPCYACKLCTDFCHKNCSFDDKNKFVVKLARVFGIENNDGIKKLHLHIDETKICFSYDYTFWFQDFGKNIFKTEKEAKQALKLNF